MISTKNKLCSIIITAYQRDKYIKKTIESVYNQNYRPLECIIIDDGSTDNTETVVKKLIEDLSDNQFILKYHKTENNGACSARNCGFQISTGSFIQNLDSDDILHPHKLSSQIKALNNNHDCQSSVSPLLRFQDTDTLDFQELSNYEIIKSTNNLFKPEFMPSVGLHRREVITKTGLWNKELKRWQDLEYQLRIMQYVNKYVYFHEPMYFFRQHDNGRISDQISTTSGISAGLLTLDSIESIITENNLYKADLRSTIYESYLSIYFTSVLNGSKMYSLISVKKSLLWTPTTRQKLRLKAVFLLTAFFPTKLLRLLLTKLKYINS